MNKTVLILSLTVALLIGCLVGGVGAQLVVPPARAGTSPVKWEYACYQMGHFHSGKDVANIANQYGAAGFEMVGAGQPNTSIWCFKRQLP